ncbi:MAG: iron-containing alcohol dehydrogenase [Deltaproteobacteria bacterium]|jgi:NADP-dependent alcohol dehydrogenase|nr:iron-containing alcohol dehydrogenase [Deltaproteobacteria bacterium]
MYDFEFHKPTQIIFGRGKEEEIGAVLNRDGIVKVLLVYGSRSIHKSGLLERLKENLGRQGVVFAEFGGVVSNPVLSHTRKGIELAKSIDVEAILAVGGGSVLDEGKAIAVGAVAEADIWQYFTGRVVTAALPIYTILTLAATGSEMNGNSVVTNEESSQKYSLTSPLVYPRVSILDPQLTCSVPADYSAYGAVDAIAHVLEAYFTRQPGSRLQDRMVESIIKTVMASHEVIRRHPDNYEARAEFMWTATLALNGLTSAGVGADSFPIHMIEQSLSALYNIAHGAGLAIVMPAWMRWYSRQHPSQFERFADKIFGLKGAEAGIEALEKWFQEIGAPVRLQDAGIALADIALIAENAAELARLWEVDDLYPREVIADILTLAVE